MRSGLVRRGKGRGFLRRGDDFLGGGEREDQERRKESWRGRKIGVLELWDGGYSLGADLYEKSE